MRFTRRNAALDARNSYPTWAHPEVLDNAEQWRVIRDCIAGHRAIQDRLEVYLPQRGGMDRDEYLSFAEYATFFNMTARTVRAMVGLAARRDPKITGVPKRLRKILKRVGYDNSSIVLFIKKAMDEVVAMGRYGILVDMDPEGRHPPYLEGFQAENILDWQTGDIEGRTVLTGVVLRSIRQKPREIGKAVEILVEYRVLELVDIDGQVVYRQRIYLTESGHAFDFASAVPDSVVVPLRFGKPMSRIPFIIPGSLSTSPDVDASPIADITHVQISHFRSSADLEFGRFYTGCPIFTVQADASQKDSEYKLGPSMVWVLGPNSQAGLLEFNGQGLTFLENALLQKEDQIAKLGGRLMGGRSRATSESDNQLKMQEANEHSTLHNVVVSLNHAMSEMLKVWAWWQGVDDVDDIECEISTEFMSNLFGAREIRAVQEMYKAGLIDLTTFHHYMQRAEVIPDWMDFDEFSASIQDPGQFPNLPDVLARMRGYPDKNSWLTHKRELRALRLDERALDDEIDLARQEFRLKKKQAEKPPAPAPRPNPNPNPPAAA